MVLLEEVCHRIPLRFQKTHQHSLCGISFSLPQGCISRSELPARASEPCLPDYCHAPIPYHDCHELSLWNCEPQLSLSSVSCLGQGVLSQQQNNIRDKRELYRVLGSLPFSREGHWGGFESSSQTLGGRVASTSPWKLLVLFF